MENEDALPQADLRRRVLARCSGVIGLTDFRVNVVDIVAVRR